jgi:UDPglucose 6-dehydrogenase
MKIAIFGSGYVGLVTGACFAEMGHSVSCIDVNSDIVDRLNKGIATVYEPGLEKLLETNLKSGRLKFTSESKSAVYESEVIFIAVGTPSSSDGSAELKHVLSAAQSIADSIQDYKLVVIKSTVPVGTHHQISEIIKKSLQVRNADVQFDLVSNPEFLRQGHAVLDCMNANRIVIGTENEKAKNILKNLYAPFLRDGAPFIVMDPASAEMTKYAANVMLASKISLMNEFSRLCEKVGADIELVREGIGSDPRIGPHSIHAGIGFGGTCFPKDVSALIDLGNKFNEPLQIVKAIESTNKLQRQIFIKKIIEKVKSNRLNKISIWGLSFKPGTDDIREAPSIDIINALLEINCIVQCYDPVAQSNAQKIFKNIAAVQFFDDQYEALKDSEILIIPTEWNSFLNPDFDLIKSKMKSHIIYDGRNIYKPKELEKIGIEYHCVGRP